MDAQQELSVKLFTLNETHYRAAPAPATGVATADDLTILLAKFKYALSKTFGCPSMYENLKKEALQMYEHQDFNTLTPKQKSILGVQQSQTLTNNQKFRLGINDFMELSAKYLNVAKQVENVSVVLFHHSSGYAKDVGPFVQENNVYMPTETAALKFTSFSKKRIPYLTDFVKQFNERYREMSVKCKIAMAGPGNNGYANAVNGPQWSNRPTEREYSKATPEQRKELDAKEMATTKQYKNYPISKKDSNLSIECCVHGHNPNMIGMFLREEDNCARLSLDTRYAINCLAYGYIGTRLQLQLKEDIFTGNEKLVHENLVKLAYTVDLAHFKENTRIYVGPLISNSTRLVFIRSGRDQSIAFIKDNAIKYELMEEKDQPVSYNALVLCSAQINNRSDVDGYTFDVCTNETNDRNDDLLIASVDSGTFTPQLKIKGDIIEFTFMASSKDSKCGQCLRFDFEKGRVAERYPIILREKFKRFETKLKLEGIFENGILVGTDYEGHIKDHETFLKLEKKILPDVNKRLYRVFTGDATDHGRENIKTLQALTKKDEYDLLLVGNRDGNKLRFEHEIFASPFQTPATNAFLHVDILEDWKTYEDYVKWLDGLHEQKRILVKGTDDLPYGERVGGGSFDIEYLNRLEGEADDFLAKKDSKYSANFWLRNLGILKPLKSSKNADSLMLVKKKHNGVFSILYITERKFHKCYLLETKDFENFTYTDINIRERLRWKKIGTEMPKDSQLLENTDLVEALKEDIKRRFTRLELIQKFGIKNLQTNHVVKVGSTLGSKWEECGTDMPKGGRLLNNTNLVNALKEDIKPEFTPKECEAFGINKLQTNNVVKVGKDYFKPVGIQYFKHADIKIFDKIGMYIEAAGKRKGNITFNIKAFLQERTMNETFKVNLKSKLDGEDDEEYDLKRTKILHVLGDVEFDFSESWLHVFHAFVRNPTKINIEQLKVLKLSYDEVVVCEKNEKDRTPNISNVISTIQQRKENSPRRSRSELSLHLLTFFDERLPIPRRSDLF